MTLSYFYNLSLHTFNNLSKNKAMKNFFKCTILLLVAGACTNDDFITEEVDSPTKPVGVQSVNRNMDEVLQIANNAARLLENAQTRSVGRTIDPAATQYVVAPATRAGGGNDTLLYIVNYTDEQGFAVVAANRNTEGLLAVTEQGSYGVDGKYYTDNPGFTEFMERAKVYAGMGGDLTKPAEIIQFKYVYDTVYENKVEPMVRVRWGQSGVEGKYCPNGLSGCSNTAMAQIMSYFHHPQSIAITYEGASVSTQTLNWTAMEKHEVSHSYKEGCTATEAGHEAISQLLRQLGKINKSKYKNVPRETSTYASDVRNSFSNMGYTVSTLNSYTDQALDKALANGELIYMRGTDTDDKGGHGWVVDGAYAYTVRTEEWRRPAGQLDWDFFGYAGSTTVEYLHYNWGWDGNCNGFFTSRMFSPDHGTRYDDTTSYSNNLDYNFADETFYFTVTR